MKRLLYCTLLLQPLQSNSTTVITPPQEQPILDVAVDINDKQEHINKTQKTLVEADTILQKIAGFSKQCSDAIAEHFNTTIDDDQALARQTGALLSENVDITKEAKEMSHVEELKNRLIGIASLIDQPLLELQQNALKLKKELAASIKQHLPSSQDLEKKAQELINACKKQHELCSQTVQTSLNTTLEAIKTQLNKAKKHSNDNIIKAKTDNLQHEIKQIITEEKNVAHLKANAPHDKNIAADDPTHIIPLHKKCINYINQAIHQVKKSFHDFKHWLYSNAQNAA